MAQDTYRRLGASSEKKDVHAAVAGHDKGETPGAFCKISKDVAGDPGYCSVLHADGAGTKSILAYLMYRETSDAGWFRGIAQDSTVMNIDDLLCVGATGPFVLSNTIGRNAHRVGADVVRALIDGYAMFAETLAKYDVHIELAGGETADIGDLVGTVVVDSTAFTRLPRSRVVDCSNIRPGDVIVGLASFGKADYETKENSGISSNGLTAARHVMLGKYYAEKYPETWSATLNPADAYFGAYRLENALPGSTMTVGEALLSPTRTYALIIKELLDTHFDKIHGIIHCTGGGQHKCRSFGSGLHYVKDSLFPTPPIFQALAGTGAIAGEELYRVFNMGHRMEVYCRGEDADGVIQTAFRHNVQAKVIGHVKKNGGEGNRVTISRHAEDMQ